VKRPVTVDVAELEAMREALRGLLARVEGLLEQAAPSSPARAARPPVVVDDVARMRARKALRSAGVRLGPDEPGGGRPR
jgi:hypothetical protein